MAAMTVASGISRREVANFAATAPRRPRRGMRRSPEGAASWVAAGSWAARAWLGFPGLVDGGLGDLVVYAEDPRADLRVLRDPARIVLRGRVVR